MTVKEQLELEIGAGAKVCRSPLRYVGGKYFQAKAIIALMPTHKHYVEVFGGGAHVLCQKPPGLSGLETYNDIDAAVLNFFEVLRDHRAELERRLRYTPYSRLLRNELAARARDGGLDQGDQIQWAVDWFTLLRQVHTGRFDSGWAYVRTQSRRGMAGTVARWQSAIERLEALAERFRRVQLECSDFRKLIPRYDAPRTLFYCDPPYVEADRNYRHGFVAQDHRDLAFVLAQIQGKAMVSYRPHALVNELYAGWSRETWDVPDWTPTGQSGQRRARATELLLTNFDPGAGPADCDGVVR